MALPGRLRLLRRGGRRPRRNRPRRGRGGGRPPARALLERHRGRALRGLGRPGEAQTHIERALAFFRANGEAYNTARALTDVSEVLLARGESGTALPLIDEAIRILSEENADQHVEHLRRLRERCSDPGQE
ncbi:tetratricopeptide repeat protein [Streptomyces sp. CAI 127]|uniref:tetratricopeptide repeat protein n=1 Tax=Streptomyces sp. CAI 127 TaxID=1076397 RepID=UPI0028159FFA|nr:tetratricopeptide repeat protein [Streptomyces sp. CAI 127]